MYVPRWELGGFDVLEDRDKCPIILEMVRALIKIDRAELTKLPSMPPLYAAGVRYFFQGEQDDWKDAIQVLASGGGSCNSLAAWRAAELQLAGENAGPYVQTQMQMTAHGPQHVFHVIVRRGDGSYECPSRTLGMPNASPSE